MQELDQGKKTAEFDKLACFGNNCNTVVQSMLSDPYY